MHKRFLKIFAATMAIMLSIVFSVQNVGAEVYENITDLGLTSKSAILMEADSGTIIYEINSHGKNATGKCYKSYDITSYI